jgi:hypothetical protein
MTVRRQWNNFFWSISLKHDIIPNLDLLEIKAKLFDCFSYSMPFIEFLISVETVDQNNTIVSIFFRSSKTVNSQTEKKFTGFFKAIAKKLNLVLSLKSSPVQMNNTNLLEFCKILINAQNITTLCSKSIFEKVCLVFPQFSSPSNFKQELLEEAEQPTDSTRIQAFDDYVENLENQNSSISSKENISIEVNSGLSQSLLNLNINEDCFPFEQFLQGFQQQCVSIEEIFLEETSLVSKQIKIENIGTLLNKEIAQLKYILPTSTKNILKIAQVIFSTRNAQDLLHASIFSVIQSFWLNNKILFEGLKTEHLESPYISSESPKVKIDAKCANFKFVLLFNLLSLYGEDISLLTIHTISNAFRSELDPEALTKVIKKDVQNNDRDYKNISLGRISKICVKNSIHGGFTFKKKRTGLQSALSYEIIKNLDFCNQIYYRKKDISKKVSKLFSETILGFGLGKNKSDEKVLESLKSILTPDGEFFNIKFNFSIAEKRLLGELILTIYEIIGLLGVEKTQQSVKTTDISTLPEEFIKNLYNLGSVGTNYPFITKPSEWMFENNPPVLGTIFENKIKLKTNWGGFLSDKGRYFPALKKRGLDSYELLSSQHLEQLNFLQSTPFVINTQFLDFCLDNWIRCVLLFSESPLIESFHGPILEQNIRSIFKYSEKTNRLTLLSEKEFVQSYCEKNTPMVPESKYVDIKSHARYHKYLSKIQRLFSEEIYASQLADFTSFISILHSAKLFSKTTLFFSWSYDHRFRVYPNCGLLSPQGRDLAKSLLDLKLED